MEAGYPDSNDWAPATDLLVPLSGCLYQCQNINHLTTGAGAADWSRNLFICFLPAHFISLLQLQEKSRGEGGKGGVLKGMRG